MGKAWCKWLIAFIAVWVFLKQDICPEGKEVVFSNECLHEIELVAGTYNIYGVIGYDKHGNEWVIPWQNIRGFKNENSSD